MIRRIRIVAAILAGILALGASSSAAAREEPRLPQILKRLSRVAELYRDTALKFACWEQVDSEGFATRPFTYYYVYEFDREEGFRDYRKAPANTPVERRKRRPPLYLMRAYSWAFLFSKSEQPLHHYRLIADKGDGEQALGRPALLIQFEPRLPLSKDRDQWFGHVWVDAGSYQILKIDAIHASRLEDYRRFRDELGRAARTGSVTRELFRFDKYVTEFSVERNGMRFPGQVVIEGNRYRVNNPRRKEKFRVDRIFRVSQRYSNYLFFNIRTAEEIRKIILED